MISNRIYLIVRKTLIYLTYHLMVLISRLILRNSKRPGKVFGDSVKTLLPAWNLLISNVGKPTPETEIELRTSARSLLMNILPIEARNLIPSLQKREKPVLNTWTYQNNKMEWDIAPNDIVIDIGCGGWPFKRANHLADKFPEKTTHRTEALVRDERPFFEVDLERLPFDDQTYDFIFCSHVLEHLDNPGQAIRELMRIGGRGYIEVPTRQSDIMFNFTRLPDHHRWHGMILGNTLVLIEWNDFERRDLGNHYFDLLHSEYENEFQVFFEHNRDLFFVSYQWEKTINFMIINKQGKVIDSSGSWS